MHDVYLLAHVASPTTLLLDSQAAATVNKLIARFRGIACFTLYLNTPVSTGNRNSALPSPISPPNIPIGVP